MGMHIKRLHQRNEKCKVILLHKKPSIYHSILRVKFHYNEKVRNKNLAVVT